jgi:uncharacterized protein (DUF2141 family)
MIKTEVIAPNVLKIIAPEKLNANDFSELAPQVESIMKQQGQIRLLIDASRLEGWRTSPRSRSTRLSSRRISKRSSVSP